jgi:hypothetical protein
MRADQAVRALFASWPSIEQQVVSTNAVPDPAAWITEARQSLKEFIDSKARSGCRERDDSGRWIAGSANVCLALASFVFFGVLTF